MALINERVIEDGFWLVLLMALTAFFWFHRRGKRSTSRSDENAMKTQHASKLVETPKKVA